MRERGRADDWRFRHFMLELSGASMPCVRCRLQAVLVCLHCRFSPDLHWCSLLSEDLERCHNGEITSPAYPSRSSNHTRLQRYCTNLFCLSSGCVCASAHTDTCVCVCVLCVCVCVLCCVVLCVCVCVCACDFDTFIIYFCRHLSITIGLNYVFLMRYVYLQIDQNWNKKWKLY